MKPENKEQMTILCIRPIETTVLTVHASVKEREERLNLREI
jgi:hypothetical protein